MEQAPHYPISTLREICAIPDEALPRFLAELPTIIAEARRFYAARDAVLEALGDEIEDIITTPEWVDDDLNQVTVSARFAGDDDPVLTATTKRAS